MNPLNAPPDVNSTEESEFHRLLREVQSGSQEAGWQLLGIYGPHVHRVVRRMLSSDLRTKFDSVDFVQSVWLSFFSNQKQIAAFEKPEQLVGYLAAMARNKVVTETRRRVFTQKRDIRREKSLSGDMPELPTRDPTPSQFAIAKERWTQLMDGQPEHYRQILHLKYTGETNEAIAESLGMNEKTIRRVLEKLLATVGTL